MWRRLVATSERRRRAELRNVPAVVRQNSLDAEDVEQDLGGPLHPGVT